jgi:outer membrane protein TolC
LEIDKAMSFTNRLTLLVKALRGIFFLPLLNACSKRIGSLLFVGAILFFLLPDQGYGQTASISIDSCYRWARQNYPLLKRSELILKSNEYSLSNLSKGYLPQVSFSAQGSYQSDVTGISIQGFNIEPLSKDQYKAYVDLNQPIFDGGTISAQRKIQQANAELEAANLEKELYAIKERINQLFFGTLLLKEQIQQNEILIQQLDETRKRVEGRLSNGTAYRSDVEQVRSSILLQQQRGYELEAGIENYLQMLSAFIGRKVTDPMSLVRPVELQVDNSEMNSRAELKVFDMQNELLRSQLSLVNSKTLPKLSLFGQGGYGRPGLNLLKNEFDWFYLGGLRLNWSISSLYTSRKEKSVIAIQQKQNEVQRETFLFNNGLSLSQIKSEASKIAKLVNNDDEIIMLKESIAKSSKAKYDNGVISLNDYLKDLTDLNSARQNKAVHEVQALLNQYNLNTTLGR